MIFRYIFSIVFVFIFSTHHSYSQVYDKYSGQKQYAISVNVGGAYLPIPVGFFKHLRGNEKPDIARKDIADLAELDYAEGMQYLEAQKYDSAIKKFSRITGRKMLFTEYRYMFDLGNYNISYCYYLKDDLKMCKKYLKRVSSNQIGDLSLSTLKGRLYYEIDKFRKAEDYFLEAVNDDLNKELAFQYLTFLYQNELASERDLENIQTEYDNWVRSINNTQEDELNDDFEMDLGNDEN